jgi:hypothetical protein
MSWDLSLEDPVTLPDGRVIWTLREAAEFIQALPAAEVGHERWQAAIEALIMAAEKRGPVMHARLGTAFLQFSLGG